MVMRFCRLIKPLSQAMGKTTLPNKSVTENHDRRSTACEIVEPETTGYKKSCLRA